MSEPTLTIFTNGVVIGAISDLENGKFINDLSTGTQLGVVVGASDAIITQQAKDMLGNAQREGGSFAPVMLTSSSVDGSKSIATWGIGKGIMPPLIGRCCDLRVLDELRVVEFDAPDNFFEDDDIGENP